MIVATIHVQMFDKYIILAKEFELPFDCKVLIHENLILYLPQHCLQILVMSLKNYIINTVALCNIDPV